MNIFKAMADSYRTLMNNGEIDKETAFQNIRIYEFLATCSKEDLCQMVDSSAFNNIIEAFVVAAVDHAGIDENAKAKVMEQLDWLFEHKTAKQVVDGE